MFKDKISTIVNAIPTKYKDWVSEKLQYSNEPTLLNRLEMILEELPISLKSKLFHSEKDFVVSVKNTRNYYTHYSKHLKKSALIDSELFIATEKLKVVLVAFLLKEIEILDEGFIKEFMKRGHNLFYYTFKDFKSFTPK